MTLTFDLLTTKYTVSLTTNYAKFHWNWFIRFQNIASQVLFGNRWTDKWTDRKDYAYGQSRLAKASKFTDKLKFFSLSILLLLICMPWTITGQPENSVFIRRVQLGKAAIKFCQGTGFDNVGHRLGLARRSLSASLNLLLQAESLFCVC